MVKKSSNSGQALIELLVILLSFAMLLIGFIFVSGMSIANIEILLTNKADSELSAAHQSEGAAGREILTWQYSSYKVDNLTGSDTDIDIPFLLKDRIIGSGGDLSALADGFNNSIYSDASNRGDYVFNPFDKLTYTALHNFGTNPPYFGYYAANLIKNAHISQNNVTTLNAAKSGGMLTSADIAKLYEAMRLLTGSDVGSLRLENAVSNQVYSPALEIK